MKNLALIALALTAYLLLPHATFARESSRPEAIYPTDPAFVQKICSDNTTEKVRTISLIQAGASTKDMGFDFSKSKSLIAASIVVARVPSPYNQPYEFTCFYESAKIRFKAATDGALGQIHIEINHQERTDSLELYRLRAGGAMKWSRSAAYHEAVFTAFSPVDRSEIKNLPVTSGTGYRVDISVTDKTIPSLVSIPSGSVDLNQPHEQIYAFYIDADKTPYMFLASHDTISKIYHQHQSCTRITATQLEQEIARGLSPAQISEKYYRQNCAN